jgi:hypothetical protein
MKKEEMRCPNCIFFNETADDDYCHASAASIVDNDDDHIISFPIILNPKSMWCGQGEWEGPAKDNPETNVLYRWGEWDK